MDVLPAIDLRGGMVVRLSQGDFDRQTTYSQDPVAVARALAKAGARWIHVVDLDGARSGRPTHGQAVRAIRQAVRVGIQLGGGLRDESAIEAALAAGADRAVVGSAAVQDWKWFERLMQRPDLAGRIALGLDARDDRIAAEGWAKQLRADPAELARRTRGWPLGAIVYTDISRDGMLTGVNLPKTAELIAGTDVPVIASGGVASLDDVAGCKRIGCAGVVVGRAYYEGGIDLAQAYKLAAEKTDYA